MAGKNIDTGLVILGALYVVPEFFILVKFSGDLEPWSFWLLILWLPLFLVVYYWNRVRALAYGFVTAVLLNIAVWGCMTWVIKTIIDQKLKGA